MLRSSAILRMVLGALDPSILRLQVHACSSALAASKSASLAHTGSPSSVRTLAFSGAAVADARATAPPMPVARKSSVSSQGGTKGGASSSTEDLRPISEVEAGVHFRSAGQVRGQVVGHSPGRRPGPGTRCSRCVAVTLSIHPEAPDSNTCDLATDWASGNQWAGGRCVAPRGRGLGAEG